MCLVRNLIIATRITVTVWWDVLDFYEGRIMKSDKSDVNDLAQYTMPVRILNGDTTVSNQAGANGHTTIDVHISSFEDYHNSPQWKPASEYFLNLPDDGGFTVAKQS